MVENSHIAILGRQWELSLAELEASYGADTLKPIGKHACIISGDFPIMFERLGGVIKLGQLLRKKSYKSLTEAIRDAEDLILKSRSGKSGKLQLGISVYGTRTSPSNINREALHLKKQLRTKGMSVRLVPNRAQDLNAAQVIHNKLIRENGFELIVIQHENDTYLARTIDIQDIDEYARRDREKPVRDALVGMLPPKLAQTLINLSQAGPDDMLLDPFCGTGTILMEAHLMDIAVCGTDISPAMTEASLANMEWLTKGSQEPPWNIELGDAKQFEWPLGITHVAAETFLGPALHNLPDEKVLKRIVDEVNELHVECMKNIAKQLPPNSKLALGVPAWFKNGRFITLPMVDDLEKLGYNRSKFIHSTRELYYHRPGQVVGRHILVLTRK